MPTNCRNSRNAVMSLAIEPGSVGNPRSRFVGFVFEESRRNSIAGRLRPRRGLVATLKRVAVGGLKDETWTRSFRLRSGQEPGACSTRLVRWISSSKVSGRLTIVLVACDWNGWRWTCRPMKARHDCLQACQGSNGRISFGKLVSLVFMKRSNPRDVSGMR